MKKFWTYLLGGTALAGAGYWLYRVGLTAGQRADPGDLVLVSGSELGKALPPQLSAILAGADVWVRVTARPNGRDGVIVGKPETYSAGGVSATLPSSANPPEVKFFPEAVRRLKDV